METNLSKAHLRAVVEQITNNTTSWIGSSNGQTKNNITGQTFICPTTGELDCIEVFSSFVTGNRAVDLTLHAFNTEDKTWGPVLETSTVEFNNGNTGKWISIPIAGFHLEKKMTYGFRLKCSKGLVGVGEAAGIYGHSPYQDGQEWIASSDDQPGNYFSYLSLAFKVELRA